MPPTTTTANRVLILGLGYTGTGLANRIADRHPDWTVTGTVRSAPRTPARYPLHRRVETVAYDDIVERVADRALNYTHVVCTVPPSAEGDAGGKREKFLDSLAGDAAWLGYVSTTSVYGDHRGALVDEESALLPAGAGRERQRSLRIDEERAWRAHGADVFRCGGIYGPYRNVLDSLVRRWREAGQGAGSGAGSAGRRREKATTARVHVLDLCRVIERRMRMKESTSTSVPVSVSVSVSVSDGAVFNVVDDDDVGRRAVEEYVLRESGLFEDYCRGLGIDDAIDASAILGKLEAATAESEKRVSNRKIKEELDVRLCYPSVRLGLEGLVYGGDLRPFDVS